MYKQEGNMAQRFPGTVPNQGPAGSPQQRYPPPQNPAMRQYPVQNFPVSNSIKNIVLL